jgi:hypothetical protein
MAVVKAAEVGTGRAVVDITDIAHKAVGEWNAKAVGASSGLAVARVSSCGRPVLCLMQG